MSLKIRLATPADAPSVVEIYDEAKAFFKQTGLDQWQDGYPSEDSFLQDVERGEGYVGEIQGEIAVTFMFKLGAEPDYNAVDGAWISQADCCAILHRIAVKSAYKGCGTAGNIIEYIARKSRKAGVESLRGDTHEGNAAMRRMFEKNDFACCGTIILARSGDKRLAFEKIL